MNNLRHQPMLILLSKLEADWLLLNSVDVAMYSEIHVHPLKLQTVNPKSNRH